LLLTCIIAQLPKPWSGQVEDGNALERRDFATPSSAGLWVRAFTNSLSSGRTGNRPAAILRFSEFSL